MKTLNQFSALEQNSISNYELNTIRGGTSGGGTSQMDEDILLYDPVPDKEKKD